MEEPSASAGGDGMTTPFDAEDVVWRYRLAHETKDAAECDRLRQAWKKWQGEDSLHAMALGEPIEPDAITERKQWLVGRLRQIEAELAWLSVFGTDQAAEGVSDPLNAPSGAMPVRQAIRRQ